MAPPPPPQQPEEGGRGNHSSSSGAEQAAGEQQQLEYLRAEHRARLKDSARESRFQFRNIAEHTLRRELKEEALETCDPQVRAFAECAEEKGLMVVVSCRALFKEVNACLAIYNGPEAWEAYKAKHEGEIQRRARLGAPSSAAASRTEP
jgi:Cytochrome c oxidase biogenesis protein Cmc1 like